MWGWGPPGGTRGAGTSRTLGRVGLGSLCGAGAAVGQPPTRAPPWQCVIQVLPPLPTRGLGPADVPALTERVRAAMLDAFEALSAELRPTGSQSDPQSDPAAAPSDPQSPAAAQSDPQSDPRQPTATRSDPQSPTDPWSDPQRPAVTQGDPQPSTVPHGGTPQ